MSDRHGRHAWVLLEYAGRRIYAELVGSAEPAWRACEVGGGIGPTPVTDSELLAAIKAAHDRAAAKHLDAEA